VAPLEDPPVRPVSSRNDVTLGALFLEFAKIGLCGIGSLLAWAHRVIVDERHWMSEAEFAETLSLCQFLPGPENANISIYVGSKFRGPTGATVAFLGLTAAPLAVGLVLGILYLQYPHLPVIQKVLGGISAAAAGMLIATGIKIAERECGSVLFVHQGEIDAKGRGTPRSEHDEAL
jgi:chromate transporter